MAAPVWCTRKIAPSTGLTEKRPQMSAVSADVISAALFARFRSRQEHTFAEKVLSAMRKGFGGHVEPEAAPGKSRPEPAKP